MKPNVIPESSAGVTPEWLDSALRSSGVVDDQRVVDVEIEPLGSGSGMNSSAAVVRPTYSGAGVAPLALFAKFVSSIEGRRSFASHFQVFKREIDAYSKLGGKLPIQMPRFLYGDYADATDAGVLLLEFVEGRRVVELAENERRAGLSVTTRKVALVPLARMHAEWSDTSRLDELDWLPDWKEFSASAFRNVSGGLNSDLRKMVGPYLSGREIDLFDEAWGNIPEIEERLSGMPHTLCHGDFHAQNMIWDSLPEANSVVVLDWQGINRGPAVRDLSYFLALTSSRDSPREAFLEAVRFYHQQLSDSAYPISQLIEDLAPATLENIVRFQAFFSATDLSTVAGYAGDLFAMLCNAASAFSTPRIPRRSTGED